VVKKIGLLVIVFAVGFTTGMFIDTGRERTDDRLQAAADTIDSTITDAHNQAGSASAYITEASDLNSELADSIGRGQEAAGRSEESINNIIRTVDELAAEAGQSATGIDDALDLSKRITEELRQLQEGCYLEN